jgi:pimeloyl-ACP methyl ester carboxylesterase
MSDQPPEKVDEKPNFIDLWATVNGTKLHFVQLGDGPTVVLVPGWPQSWYAWRLVMPLLAKSGRRVIACDPPGLGDSDLLPSGKKYDTGGVADLLAEALHLLGIKRADLVGHDVGTLDLLRLCDQASGFSAAARADGGGGSWGNARIRLRTSECTESFSILF